MTIPSPAFRFCLCADDYAMTPAVSRGILEALEARSLSATSAMTNAPSWAGSAAALRPHAARADIGLHLNLTSGAPLAPMPALAPSGTLPAIGTFLRAGSNLPLGEIADEVGRQIDAFTAAWGAAPDHLDGHQHVHALPAIRDLVLDELDRRGLAGKLWLRDSTDRPMRVLRRGTSLKKALGLAWLGRGMAAAAGRRSYTTNDGFAGFSDFRLGQDNSELFGRFLRAPGSRHLVMCHPGHVDDALRQLDPVTDSREEELRFLLSPAFKALLADTGGKLERLSRIATEQANTA